MRSLIVVFLILCAAQAFAGPAFEDCWSTPGGYIAPVPGPVYFWDRTVLHNNGPVWNATYGTYYESILQNSLGMTTYGFGHAISAGYRMADDFTIPEGETWDISTITFFGYQTGAATNPSTFTSYVVQIWNGVPGVGTVIWGDLTTNRLTSSVWSNVYRTLESTPHTTNRPIFANTCAVPVSLPPGHYWLDWACSGTLTSGPWAPPIAIWGGTITGDAYQYNPTTLTWGPANDGGTGTPRQGLPFIIEGEIPSPVEAATWGGIKALYR
jgi:hypothetical protein